MRKAANKELGDTATFHIAFDPTPRIIEIHPKLKNGLKENVEANGVFESLTPSLRKEIIRYINLLKTDESIDRNVENAIQFLIGKKRFIGRDKP